MALRQNSDKEPSIELFIKVSLFFFIYVLRKINYFKFNMIFFIRFNLKSVTWFA